jgi:ATP-binding protein involved in chromosome partitioning
MDPMNSENNCDSCSDPNCSARERRPGEDDGQYRDRQVLLSRMCRIKHKIMVLSGKGGVGKSTVAVNVAAGLAMAGKRVGLLDVDLHGPSVPKLLGLDGAAVTGLDHSFSPVKVGYRTGLLSVMSIGFLLRDRDDAVIWRGPRKFGAIKQFLQDVEWGELDYLVVDSPPGTGDEPLAVAQLIENADGAIVVTTPQALAVQDVRRCIVFCRHLELPVLGVVENMSGFTCPDCGRVVEIFGREGGRSMSEEMGVPFLGSIPIEAEVVTAGDSGTPVVKARPESAVAQAFGRVVSELLASDAEVAEAEAAAPSPGQATRIAIPVADGVLASHFGHCEKFVLFDVGADQKSIDSRRVLPAPPHEPGTFPKWLHEQGATVIIAGGMGSRAQDLCGENGIRVVVGASNVDPELVVRDFLEGRLVTGPSQCDH